MKKLVMAAAIVCAAVLAQAASVTWQSGVVFIPSDDKGTLSAKADYKIADSATATMYLFALADETAYNKVASDGVWATYGSKLDTATKSTSTLSSGKFADLETTGYAASSTAYAAILFTYKDADGKDWYLENMAKVDINDLGGDGISQNLARYIGGVKDNGQMAAWGTESVPEPTSGMLLLMGLAGLALRRKQK